MKYRLLCIGRQVRDPLLAATQDYSSRLQHYVPFELVRLRPASAKVQGAQLLKLIGPQDVVVSLDEHGTAITSLDLARTVAAWATSGKRCIVFVVGAAAGLDPQIKARANLSWTLSQLTLPHRMAQMLLVEQLYRAHSIVAGAPYHRS